MSFTKKFLSNVSYGPVFSAIFFMIIAFSFNNSLLYAKNDGGTKVNETCSQCHEDLAKDFSKSVHGVVKNDCSTCHGLSQKHVETGEYDKLRMNSFKKENSIRNYSKCIGCHAKTVSGYPASDHASAGLDCSVCHSIHKKDRALAGHSSKLCASCHRDIYAQFNLNEHHRLKEGIVECTSCHNPHEKSTVMKLGGFKDAVCSKCHMDKVGPFVYEHMPVKVEGCTFCHETHGSPNRHMLKHQSVRELCLSCHSEVPQWHTRFLTSDTNCANCHSAIHGSNLDQLFLK